MEAKLKGPERIQAALAAAGLDIEVVQLEDSARTAKLAAQALQTELGSIVKSLVFIADDQPVLVLVAGDRRVDTRKLKRLLSASDVSIADADTVRQQTGFSIGGVPPVGHAKELPTWIDGSLGRFQTVYAAAGGPHAVFPIPYPMLLQVTGGQVADVTETTS
jgi:prolyl-tRNA editing enzyme YbaK/EbsC (Cys-tRNA(Pro) deacylase)